MADRFHTLIDAVRKQKKLNINTHKLLEKEDRRVSIKIRHYFYVTRVLNCPERVVFCINVQIENKEIFNYYIVSQTMSAHN